MELHRIWAEMIPTVLSARLTDMPNLRLKNIELHLSRPGATPLTRVPFEASCMERRWRSRKN
jgi:hypothetical protein